MKKILSIVALVIVFGACGLALAAPNAHTDASGYVCLTCHTVHNSTVDSSIAVPLWAGMDPCYSAPSFTVYDNKIHDEPNQPDGDSKLCLACHDGSSDAMDGSKIQDANSDGYIGTVLTDDHPISFAYKTGTVSGYVASTDAGVVALLDGNGKVQCTSCHSVHSDLTSALVMAATDLCQKCHDR